MIEKLIEQLKVAEAQKLIKRVEVFPQKEQHKAKTAITAIFITLHESTPYNTRVALTAQIEKEYQCKVRPLTTKSSETSNVLFVFQDLS